MGPLKVPAFILLAFIMMIVSLSLFTVYQTEQGLVVRLGDIKKNSSGEPVVLSPGLHIKMPFIDTVRLFDTRIQTFDLQSERVITGEKKYLIVDVFVKWRVKDVATFFIRTNGDTLLASKLLREAIIDGVRAEFGQRTIQEVVSGERQAVMDRLRLEAQRNSQGLGIEIVDARVKRIDLPTQVSDGVFARMRSERHRVAEEYRAKGQSKAEQIRAEADAAVTVLLATAEKEAKELKGQGDAVAAKVYGQAYSQDPEFYRFYRSMEAYKASFSQKEDVLVLDPNSEFFDYMAHSKGK